MIKRFGRVDTMFVGNDTYRWAKHSDGSLTHTARGVAFRIEGNRLYVASKYQEWGWMPVAESKNLSDLKQYARDYANKEPWTYKSDL